MKAAAVRYALAAIKGVGAQAMESVVAERRANGQGAQLADELKQRAPAIRLELLDPQMPEPALAQSPEGCETTVVAAFLLPG